MPKLYKYADEVERIAERLIPKFHQHLCMVHIEYWFVNKASSKGGKTILGSAKTISGIAAAIANKSDGEREGDFFTIQISEDTWFNLSDKQREALVDHELEHCKIGVDGQGNSVLELQAHDVEEFQCIIERHGFWKKDVADFAKTVQSVQLKMEV